MNKRISAAFMILTSQQKKVVKITARSSTSSNKESTHVVCNIPGVFPDTRTLNTLSETSLDCTTLEAGERLTP